MKKFIYLFAMLATSLITFAQTDSINVDTTKASFETYAGAIIASRNYARGVNFGSGVSLQPYAGISYSNLTLELFAALSANGNYNYGTTTDFSLSYEYKRFKIGIHDYYFFNKIDSTHNYFFETSDPFRDGHYYEVQIGYSNDKFAVLAAHNFYNTNLEVTDKLMKTVYLEAKYKLSKRFAIIIGGVTGPSIVNFYDKEGITTAGLEWNRELKINNEITTILDVKFHINPNYENISPGVQKAPMNFFVSFTF